MDRSWLAEWDLDYFRCQDPECGMVLWQECSPSNRIVRTIRFVEGWRVIRAIYARLEPYGA